MAGTEDRFALRTNAHVRNDKAVANRMYPDLRPVWWRVVAVMGLSVLVGSGWLLTDAYPSEIGFPFAGCIHFAVIGLVGLIGTQWKSWCWRKGAEVATAGAMVFVLPGIVHALTAGMVSGSANVALSCAVPLMIVLGSAWFGQGSGWTFFMPSLAGLSGALLVFSVEVPGSLRRAVGLATVLGCCVVVAAAVVWMFRLLRGVALGQALAVVGMAGAIILGVYGVAASWPRITLNAIGIESLRCAVFDLPVVWMTVWLMRKVSPVRLAARFLIAPVVTWVEGYAMIRGAVEMRSIAALALMAAGAVMLLVKGESEDVTGLGLR